MPAFRDERGVLVAIDEGALAFVPRRTFLVAATPADVVRGDHVVPCRQTMVLISGEVEVELRAEDGVVDVERLSEVGDAVDLRPGEFVRYRFTAPGAVVVFADEPYAGGADR